MAQIKDAQIAGFPAIAFAHAGDELQPARAGPASSELSSLSRSPGASTTSYKPSRNTSAGTYGALSPHDIRNRCAWIGPPCPHPCCMPSFLDSLANHTNECKHGLWEVTCKISCRAQALLQLERCVPQTLAPDAR